MHSSFASRRIALLAAAVALVIPLVSPLAAFADEDDTANIGVARVSLISGSVAVQRGDATTPSAAVINAPVLAGDYLTTGDDSRAEVEVDGGTVVRLGSGVQMRFTHLENDTRAIQLAEGTIELRLLRGTDGSSNIDTPSISVRPRSGGSYRVTVTADGQTLVTVRSGDAEIIAPQGIQSLTPGTTLVAQGAASDPSIVSQAPIEQDAFDQFNAERDAEFQHALAENTYVDNDITGAQDLAAYGNWVPDPTYGQVWVPANVAPDWAPYRDGSWVWEANFGWTWVGAEPWGWAPYHYGSWYRSPTYGWAWFPPRPGPVVPVWRPALVGFVSFGGGGGSVGIGYAGPGFGVNIGWVPLAPYEPWHPWWGNRWGGPGYANVSINNTYITNETFVHTYVNAQYGVTAVPGRRFAQGNFGHPMVVAAANLHNVQAIRGAVPVVPTAANLRFSSAHVAPELAVRPSFSQHTFAGSQAPVERVPFAQQRAAVAGAAHLPLPAAHSAVENPGAAGAYHADGTAAGRPATDAWSRFGENRGVEPATRGTGNAPSYATGANRSNADAGVSRSSTYRSPSSVAPARSYAAPSRSYAAPAQSYRAPARSYAAPARTYTPPAHHANASAPRAPKAPAHHKDHGD
jgi:hypothetical protein